MDEAHRLEAVASALDTLIAQAPFGIGLFDRQVRHVRVNRVLAEMNGESVQGLLGRTPSELHGEVGRGAEELYRGVIETGQPVLGQEVVGEVASRPGQTRHWHVSCFPAADEQGPLGLYVVVDDVTESYRLTAALEASEARYKRLSEDLQASLQPPLLPRLAGAEMASIYRPAATDLTVGGDFYDVLRTGDDSWLMAIGDVQGKGAVAASTTAAVRWAFRTSATTGTSDPVHMADTINQVLLDRGAEEGLCTLGLVHAQRRGDTIVARCVSAGHPLPRLLRASSRELLQVGEPGALLGVLPRTGVTVEEVVLEAGDALVLVTDGITEARYHSPEGGVELFGDERLDALLATCTSLSATVVAARMESAVMSFQAERAADDIAALVLRNTGPVSTH